MSKIKFGSVNPPVAALLAALLAAALLAVWVAEVAPAEAQSDDGSTVSGQIVARRLANGQTEFGWRPAGTTNVVLPHSRLFPLDAEVGDWLRSSPVEVGGVAIGWINARLRSSGKIEFAFRPTDGERISPRARYFPTNATVGAWLHSTEITFSIERSSVAQMEAAILAVLFGGEPAQANYNDWGCPNTVGQPGIECSRSVWSERELQEKKAAEPIPGGYIGGHSGWDAQTLSVAGKKTANERFYAVSPGVIKRIGSPTVNLIAVWHWQSNTTTIYMHARSLNPNLSVDDPVEVGTWLGIQGDRGSPGAEHVHIEVRAGEWTTGAGGADPSRSGPACNPVDFLWRSVQRLSTAGHTCGGATGGSSQPGGTGSGATTTTVKDGQQMYRPGTGEVYVTKIAGNQRYKRLFLTDKIRDSYGHLKGREPATVSQAEFDSFSTSCIVRFGNDYYFLDVREGANRADRFRISDGWQGLLAAGVVEAAIFAVHALEINNEAFNDRSDITAAQAVRKSCGN